MHDFALLHPTVDFRDEFLVCSPVLSDNLLFGKFLAAIGPFSPLELFAGVAVLGGSTVASLTIGASEAILSPSLATGVFAAAIHFLSDHGSLVDYDEVLFNNMLDPGDDFRAESVLFDVLDDVRTSSAEADFASSGKELVDPVLSTDSVDSGDGSLSFQVVVNSPEGLRLSDSISDGLGVFQVFNVVSSPSPQERVDMAILDFVGAEHLSDLTLSIIGLCR
jgi:hypothetical protein